MLTRARSQIELALPRHLTADRMIRVAMTAAQKSPKLLQCDPISVVGCVVESSQLGLMCDGITGEAYMVPFGNKATLIPGYRGLIKLARQSGELVSIHGYLVYSCDKFSVEYGLEPTIKHVPNFKSDKYGADNEVEFAYAVARLKDGTIQHEVMTRREVDAIRGRSRSGDRGPWVSDYGQMAKKTVLRRLLKLLPLSAEMQRAEELERQLDTGEAENLSAKVVGVEPVEEAKPALEAFSERLMGNEEAEPAPRDIPEGVDSYNPPMSPRHDEKTQPDEEPWLKDVEPDEKPDEELSSRARRKTVLSRIKALVSRVGNERANALVQKYPSILKDKDDAPLPDLKAFASALADLESAE